MRNEEIIGAEKVYSPYRLFIHGFLPGTFMENEYCLYYQASVNREKTWFVVGALRNEDHLAFERAMENKQDILEFLVPPSQEKSFLEFILQLQERGVVFWCKKQTNRFASHL